MIRRGSPPNHIYTMEKLYWLLGLAFFIGLWFLFDRILGEKLVEQTRDSPYTKFEKLEPPLGLRNGIGFRLYSGGRYDFNTNSYSWYLFFCFIIPLFPIACYRASEVSSSRKGCSYRIYGYEKWRFGEVFLIYMSIFVWIGCISCVGGFIASFF